MIRASPGCTRSNAGAIVNYGKRHRCGERISTGFVESAVNQVIAKRFVKKQQMRWTPRGAHLLLQIRTQVLNDELRASFEKWYPCFGVQVQEPRSVVAGKCCTAHPQLLAALQVPTNGQDDDFWCKSPAAAGCDL